MPTGGEYVFPTLGSYPITSDVTDSNWHVSGTVGDYSGFGIYFDNCDRLDASAYRGISFTISGTVSQGNMVTLLIGTLNNTVAASWLDTHGGDGTPTPGRCIPTSGTNRYTQTSCVDASITIPVKATPTVQNILWTDLTGGRPESSVAPSEIVSILWYFPHPTGAGTATPTTYTVDIRLDDLQLIP